MMKTLRILLGGCASALLALAVLVNAAIAQSDQAPVSITVLPFDGCTPAETMEVDAMTDPVGDAEFTWIEPGRDQSGQYVGETYDWNLSLQINVTNAGCDQWSITAELGDFALEGDPTKTFPASTLHIARDMAAPFASNPARWDATDQPAWVNALPGDLPIGPPVMPSPLNIAPEFGDTLRAHSVTFDENGVGTSALLAANSATYGSPGNMTGYYRMKLFDLPTDLYLNPGVYTAELTITVQGPD
jgi:hypothetical protein